MTQTTGAACSACGPANRTGRRFCAECGASLPVVCAGCGALNLPADRFCGGCGESLSAAAGSAPRSLPDPRSYTPKHLADKILQSKSALEGERSIIALFGAPIAHEDHAQRACYAALHLKSELRRYADELRVSRGRNLVVRMGLTARRRGGRQDRRRPAHGLHRIGPHGRARGARWKRSPRPTPAT